MTLKQLIAGLAILSVSHIAIAASGDGIYVAFDAGRSIFKNSCKDIPAIYTSCSDYDFGNRASFGKLVANFTFAEIGYYNAGKTIKQITGNIPEVIDSVEWQFSGIRLLPIGSGRFSLLGKLGVVHWEAAEANTSARTSTSGNSILLGVGGKYFITRDIAVRMIYDTHIVGNNSMSWRGNINFISAGLTYEL